MNGDMSSRAEMCAEQLMALVNDFHADIRNNGACSYETWQQFFSRFLMIERPYRSVRAYLPRAQAGGDAQWEIRTTEYCLSVMASKVEHEAQPAYTSGSVEFIRADGTVAASVPAAQLRGYWRKDAEGNG